MNRSTSYTSQIDIGIVAPELLVSAIQDALRGFPNIKSRFFITSTVSADLYTFIQQHELTLVADPLLYTELKRHDTSLHLFKFNSRSHHLYKIVLQQQLRQLSHKFSFDFMQQSDILNISHQLEQPIDYVFTSLQTCETIIAEHMQRAQQGYTPITTSAAVYEALLAAQIEAIYLVPSRLEMVVALERLLLASKSRQNKESQVVVGIIEFDCVTPKQVTKVQQILQQFVQQMDGHLIEIEPNRYNFITTRGQLERETLGYKHLPLLSQFKEELDINCVIGIGFGTYPNDSGKHAKQALYQAKETGLNVGYIVREDASAIGPIDTTVFLNFEQYPLTITDLELLERAEKAGMSATYISKLMARLAKHQKYIYTAEEIASTFNITLRSANRILLKWLDAGLVSIVGEEKLTHRGRPKRIYAMTFLENLMS